MNRQVFLHSVAWKHNILFGRSGTSRYVWTTVHLNVSSLWWEMQGGVMRSWCDVRYCMTSFHRTYESTRERVDNPVLIKISIGEFFEKLSSHFNFNLNMTILTTTLRKSANAYLSLSQSRKRLHKLIFSALFAKLHKCILAYLLP
jgi:hypothetical protein